MFEKFMDQNVFIHITTAIFVAGAMSRVLLNMKISSLFKASRDMGNSDKEILKILQKFDFTKDIPKIVVIDAIEDTFSKIECIQLILFNLMGFDIAVYTPTGYKNLETYISPSAFEVYNMNEFKYNVRVPRFRIPDAIPEPKEEGFFSKLFKKKF